MLKSEVFPKYRGYCRELVQAYGRIKELYAEDSIEKLGKMRGYPTGSSQLDYLRRMGVGYFETSDESEFREYSEELGFYNKNGDLNLNNRFIIPIYGVSGDLVSLVGYYPDRRKYITLPTPFFYKEGMFFNFKEAYEMSAGGVVVLVEGLFDCISLSSIGIPCIATMGATVSSLKGELLKLFKRVIAIPDDDPAGRRALDRYSRYGWKVPSNTVMVQFHGGDTPMGGSSLHCKDMDNFVTWYEAGDVRDVLMSFADSREEIIEYYL